MQPRGRRTAQHHIAAWQWYIAVSYYSPQPQMGSESIAHEAAGQKYQDKTTLAS